MDKVNPNAISKIRRRRIKNPWTPEPAALSWAFTGMTKKHAAQISTSQLKHRLLNFIAI
jgi:hypothetical protein